MAHRGRRRRARGRHRGLGLTRTVHLHRDSTGDALADTALSRVLLERAAGGAGPETLRVYRPRPNVAFGGQDAVTPGYAAAVDAARRAGFEPSERLAGGRAAVFHEGTVAFAWAVPDAGAWDHTNARFEELAGIVVEALSSLGVDARVGEVPGEYCPGQWSVSAGGRRKLMGVGQRVIRGGAHVGGVLVASGAGRINEVLVPVYEAMGFAWDPSATGAVEDGAPGTGFDAVAGALVAAFAARYDLDERPVAADALEEARARRHQFECRIRE